MTPFEAWVDYVALKRHFTSDYDYVKYGGKVRLKPSSFESRRDRYFFEKLARHSAPHDFLVANLSKNPGAWIGTLVREGEPTYVDWVTRRGSLAYHAASVVALLGPSLGVAIAVVSNAHPPLLRGYNAGQVSLDAALALADATSYPAAWDASSLAADPLWREMRARMLKYYGLVGGTDPVPVLDELVRRGLLP